MRKFNRKAFKRKLHALWSIYIRTRDNFTCQWCGAELDRKHTDAHHIIPKGRCGNAGRYEIENGMTLCDRCHRYRSGSEYVEFARFVDEWLKKRGTSYDELNEKYHGAIIKDDQEWFETKYKVLLKLCQEIGADLP